MSILLVSGGLDSATSTAWAIKHTKGPHIPISFFYGQRHYKEQEYASSLCTYYSLPRPREINLANAFAQIGGSSLTSGIRTGNPSSEPVKRTESDLPPSFVPGRNLIMLSIAAGIGYTEELYEIVGGWNAVDYSGYPDCRPEFFRAFEDAVNQALGFGSNPVVGVDRYRIRVHAPLITLSKADIIKLGLSMGVPYELTWSCYAGMETPCGECDSCKIREEGFNAVGIKDPARA